MNRESKKRRRASCTQPGKKKPPLPKVRGSRCRIGREEEPLTAGPGVPVKHRWMPAAFRDLADPEKLGCADMHRYLERMGPRTCALCRPRWFSHTADLPYWAESGALAALNAVCIHAPDPADDPRDAYLCATCRGPKTRDILSPANDMYIGPSFRELNCLNEIESTMGAIYRPSLRYGPSGTGRHRTLGTW